MSFNLFKAKGGLLSWLVKVNRHGNCSVGTIFPSRYLCSFTVEILALHLEIVFNSPANSTRPPLPCQSGCCQHHRTSDWSKIYLSQYQEFHLEAIRLNSILKPLSSHSTISAIVQTSKQPMQCIDLETLLYDLHLREDFQRHGSTGPTQTCNFVELFFSLRYSA